ncbi:MAG: FG-GAP-like repeat-containing protein, partial [Gammaproteobacteria bacterium]
MRRLRRAGTLTICMVAVLAALPVSSATVVGHTPGSFTVGQNGAANYTIPIVVAPGTGGLQPNIGLNYNSNRGDGLAGYGWNLTGFSVITRCARTVAQDGAALGIEFKTSDKFCLDGQRLRLTSGTYGANNSVYRTELETFVRVTAYTGGGEGYLPDTGPQYFQVETPDGLTYEYGYTEDSRIETVGRFTVEVRVWALNKITDPFGNYTLYEYAKDTVNGSYRPDKARYSGHGGALPSHSVEFEYELRPSTDYVESYLTGSRNRQLYRLRRIHTLFNTNTVRTYSLEYEPDGVALPDRSRLASVQECAGADCYPATSFDWQPGTEGWDGLFNTTRSVGSYNFVHAIDVNGDGRQDLVYPQGPSGSKTWRVMFGQANGFSSSQNTGDDANAFDMTRSIDFNSDGLRDLIYPAPNGNWAVWLATGNATANAFSPMNTTTPVGGFEQVTTFADFNGDGREDLLYATSSALMLRLNTGNGFASTAVTAHQQTGEEYGPQTMTTQNGFDNRTADFNGDGLADLLIRTTRTSSFQCPPPPEEPDCIPPPPTSEDFWTVLYSHGTTFDGMSTLGSAGDVHDPEFGDFNGDGLTDVVYRDGGVIKVRISTGWGFTAPVGAENSDGFDDALVIDWDADGKDDLLVPPATTGNWSVMHSNGASLEPRIGTGIPAQYQGRSHRMIDFNGDGLMDVTMAFGSDWQYLLHKGTIPDLLAKVTDGFGNEFTPTYKELTDSAVYEKDSTLATFPEVSVQPPQYVVASYVASNGIGGSNTMSYHYAGARIHVRGRGFLGFREIRETRPTATGGTMETTSEYAQAFPHIGLLEHSVVQRGSDKVSETTRIFDSTQMATGNDSRVFPFVSSQQVDRYNLEMAAVSTVTTTFSSHDLDNGRPELVTTTTSDGTNSWVSTVNTTFQDDTSGWCLGLPTLVTVANDAPTALPETRTRSAVNDMFQCNVTSEK